MKRFIFFPNKLQKPEKSEATLLELRRDVRSYLAQNLDHHPDTLQHMFKSFCAEKGYLVRESLDRVEARRVQKSLSISSNISVLRVQAGVDKVLYVHIFNCDGKSDVTLCARRRS